MSNMTEFELDVVALEQERLNLYREDVENAIKTREKSLEHNLENASRSLVPYNKMVYLVFIQTLIMVAQTLLFAGIYFKL